MMTGSPKMVPLPSRGLDMPGKSGCPSSFRDCESPNAFDSLMIQTDPSSGMLAAAKIWMSAARSSLAAAAVTPEAAAVDAPLVIEAGLTPADTATAGSTNCTSRNCAIPAIISSRTTASADGLESFTSSSVSTMIPAALLNGTDTVANAAAVTGSVSYTHLTLPTSDLV